MMDRSVLARSISTTTKQLAASSREVREPDLLVSDIRCEDEPVAALHNSEGNRESVRQPTC